MMLPEDIERVVQVFPTFQPIDAGQSSQPNENPNRVNSLVIVLTGRNQESQIQKLKQTRHLHATGQSTHCVIIFLLSLFRGIL